MLDITLPYHGENETFTADEFEGVSPQNLDGSDFEGHWADAPQYEVTFVDGEVITVVSSELPISELEGLHQLVEAY